MFSQAAQKSPKTDDRTDLLREYKNWDSRDYPCAELLQEYSEYPSKSLWVQACHQAVKDENRAWLENPPLERLYSRVGESNTDRKNTARFISNCALKALLIKQAGKSDGASEINLQGVMKDAHASDESVKDLIQYFALDERLSEGEKAVVKVLLAENEGKLGQIEIEKIPNGEGKIFSDPAFMSFSRYEPDFEESIKTAFKYITDTERLEEAKKYNYRWRLFDRSNAKKEDSNFRVLDQRLRGSSMGFASALALGQLFKPVSFSLARYAFTGKIDENGVLKSVGEYPNKLQAGKNFTIYFPDADHEAIKHYREDGYLIKEAVTVKDAIADIKDKNRKEQIREIRNRAFAAIIPLIIVGLFIAAWIYRTNAEAAKKETNAERLQKEAAQSEANAINQRLETQKLETDSQRKLTEAERIDKENALKAQKLAEEQAALEKEQSKILAQKNVQLDEAKQVAEKNEKEATFQRGVAQTKEKIAKASQQVAYASRLAAEGYKRLAEGDKASAQTFFAKALSLDEQEEYRAGLLNASFDSGNNSYKLSWSKEIADDIDVSCCSATALDLTGDLLAVSYNNGKNVKILRSQDGNEMSNFSFEKTVADLALSAKGEYLAVKNNEGQISILETASQNVYFNFDAQHDQSLQALIFSNDNKYLAAISGSHSITVFDVQNKRVIKNINHDGEFANLEILYMTFSPENLLAYTFNGGPIFITSVADESVNKRINMWSNHYGLGFTKNGELISLDGTDISIYPEIREKFKQGWMPDSKTVRQKVRTDYLIAVNSAMPYYVTAGDNGIIHFRDGDEQIHQISFPMGKPVKLMLGDNGRVLFQNSKGKVYCWEPYASDYQKYELSQDALYAAGITRGVEQEGDKILVKDVKSEDVVFSLKLNQSGKEYFYAVLSEDQKMLAVTQGSKLIEIYEIESGKKLFQFSFKEGSKIDQVLYFVISNDGKTIAAAGANSIAIISLATSQILATIDFPLYFSEKFYLQSLSFSPQDNFLVFQSENSVNLLDIATGTMKHSIPFSPRECPKEIAVCSWLAISPDEKFVGLTTFDGIVQLWSIENYRYLANIVRTGVESPERAVGAAFTKDSQFFAWSSAGSGRLHFYDVKENKKLSDFPTGESIDAFGLITSNNLLLSGIENVYVTNESNITALLKGKPQTISSEVFNKTGFKIDSFYSPSFSQDELDSILKNERPKFELFAVDRNGMDVRSEKDFGGLEAGTARKTKNGAQCSIAFVAPVFNAYTAYFGTGASGYCSDFAMIDIAKDTPNPQFAKSREEYFSIREYHEGDQLVVQLYINNGAANNLDPNVTVAKNVKIETSLTSENNLHKITATFSADNATSLTGNVFVRTNSDEYLEIYPNSGFMYTYDRSRYMFGSERKIIADAMELNLGNSILDLGALDSDWQYSLFFTYKIKVVKKQ